MRMKRDNSKWTDDKEARKESKQAKHDTQSAVHEPKDLSVLQRSLEAVEKRLENVATNMERTHIADYVDMLNKPLKLIWRNLLAGTARGIGIAIGFTFFAATILYVLRILGALNLPIIGDYIADIVKIVQIQLEGKQY
ncbi:hypothetical protein PAT3040_00683 [Paenibacillus agaridevorans]|uniref:Uncharacterized protein n=1 Tax=Paenibacillus agaridevorans TaxID=171404 RepID=A0A2R5ES17_9BACL|nr:DUF5665 domain-containing protein [Paenibacillus agaridevorans]GBG06174.1 hypothetical protein PAT3040_00683 [Paenibacillus agaridevorans]